LPPSAEYGLASKEGTIDAPKDLAPFLEGHVEERGLAAQSGIADQDVDAAEGLGRLSARRGGTCGSETSPMAATAVPPAATISPTTASRQPVARR